MATVIPCPTKPVVIGIYGIPASGKSHLLRNLKNCLGTEGFEFYEGSEVINNCCPGGLESFCCMNEREQEHWRTIAIRTIQEDALNKKVTAVVAGHFMFWPQGSDIRDIVYTSADLDVYTHILYLDTPSETIAKYRAADTKRRAASTSLSHLDRWKEAEKSQLRSLCRNHGILFLNLTAHISLTSAICTILKHFQVHTEAYNDELVQECLDKKLQKRDSPIETVLLFDSDKTLTPQDSGHMFWEQVHIQNQKSTGGSTLKELFDSPLRYSYTAFRQATLLYEEALDEATFEAQCRRVASFITMYSEFVNLLRVAARKPHVRIIVITCGLRQVWEEVFKREGLSDSVEVIGGGQIRNGYVVTAGVKGLLARRLQKVHNAYVWAFGDSPLDLPMKPLW